MQTIYEEKMHPPNYRLNAKYVLHMQKEKPIHNTYICITKNNN